MVRAALVTCFAGITSSVFFSLPEDKQDQIISYSINAAFNDEVPSVRSVARRAIGVIACFAQALKRLWPDFRKLVTDTPSNTQASSNNGGNDRKNPGGDGENSHSPSEEGNLGSQKWVNLNLKGDRKTG